MGQSKSFCGGPGGGFFKKSPPGDAAAEGEHLADAAYTLQVGRKVFSHRCVLVCSKIEEAIEALASLKPPKVRILSREEDRNPPPIIFMFPGQGRQYTGMGWGLYHEEPVFRQELDRGFDLFREITGHNLKETVFPGSGPGSFPAPALPGEISRLDCQDLLQPWLFIFEYALARLLIHWGVKPHCMIGYSLGEYTAACLSGVFTYPETLRLVVLRGRLMQRLPRGTMLSVPLAEERLKPLLHDHPQIAIAAVNGPSCIVSGPEPAVDTFEKQLKNQKYICMRLNVSHATHTGMMEPILGPYWLELDKCRPQPPNIPYISGTTAQWVQAGEVVASSYWIRHLTEPIRFMEGMGELVKIPGAVFLEVGVGRDLSMMVRRLIQPGQGQEVLDLIPPAVQNVSTAYYFWQRIGQLWLWGGSIDWGAVHAGQNRRRVSLPTYPFQRQDFSLPREVIRAAFNIRAGEIPAPAGEISANAREKARSRDQDPGTHRQTKETPSNRPADRTGISTEYAPPINKIQQTLARIWQEFSGMQSIGTDDDFFELGGDSIKAILVINRIRQELGIELEMHDLFARPTIRQLDPLIAGKIQVEPGQVEPGQAEPGEPGRSDLMERFIDRPVVLFNPGNREKLFCFPPGFAYGLAYRDLAGAMPGTSIYAFNFIEEGEPLEQYTRLITGSQPQGPYILFGYSAAGKLTFEVAQVLEKSGHCVSAIILADSFWPDEHIGKEVPLGVIQAVESYLEEWGLTSVRERALARVKKYRTYMKAEFPVKKVKADVHLIISTDRWGDALTRCWEPYTSGELRVYQGYGTHGDMLSQPAVEKNVRLIRQVLAAYGFR